MRAHAIAVDQRPPDTSTFHAPGLVWTLVRTDFKTRYHGTIGGFVWALLKPLAMFLVLMAVFSFVFGSEPAYKINLILGLFLYDFFSESTKAGLMSLYTKGYLLNKAKFPSWILVVASSSNALISLAIFSLVVFAFLTVTGRPPGLSAIVLYLAYVAALAVIVTGISLGASVLFLRYRDLNQVWDVVTQAGFFIAPIVYPLRTIPEQFHFYLYLWPPTAIIEFSRSVLVQGALPTLTGHLCLGLTAAAIFGAGLTVFRRLAPRAAEYL